MENYKDLIQYFNSINIDVEDVTTDLEKENFQKVVIVTYDFSGTKFTTEKLYYKEISHAPNVKHPENIEKFFGQKVYWLDIDIHQWPQSSGETDINDLIIDDITKNEDFKNELLKLANNSGNGNIQLISKQGRSNQYYRNFENNNHWHDIILLIKAIIEEKPNFDNYLMPLVFRWDGNKHTDRLRVSLSPHFGARAILYHLINNVNNKKSTVLKELIMQEYLELLQYKKQIILQGPPGTGKTKMALELAKELIGDAEGLNQNEQLEIIQFHPSYTYEDFVRGIVSVTGEKGISYEAQNKILAQFSKKALNNYLLSKDDNSEAKIDKWIEDTFEEYKTDLEERVSEKMVLLSNSIGIFDVQNDCFKYGFEWRNPSRINFKDFKILIKAVIKGTHNLESNIPKAISVHAHFRNPYYSNLLKDFFKQFQFSNTTERVIEKKYVLIIDEINRANLSTVFGELIFAFEYRGQAVESLYEVNGSRKLILPPNLLIIGTMNTADRSVSQIDYAIRRRFAFVDVLPEDLSNDESVSFDSELFKKVSLLFKNEGGTISKHLSEEFKPEEVQLGHSYFIIKEEEGGTMDIRLRYEIKPILKEYVKDGILKQSALAEIEKL